MPLFPQVCVLQKKKKGEELENLDANDAFILFPHFISSSEPREETVRLYSFPGLFLLDVEPTVQGEVYSPVARTPSSEEVRCKMGADLEADNPQALILLPCGRFPGNPVPSGS